MASQNITADGAGMRAKGAPVGSAGMTTDRTVALLLVALLVALVVIRRGFSGALGD